MVQQTVLRFDEDLWTDGQSSSEPAKSSSTTQRLVDQLDVYLFQLMRTDRLALG